MVVVNLLSAERYTHFCEGGGGKTLTGHLIHRILVRGPSLNSGWLQCRAPGGEQKAEVIGLEYGIERQTTKDIHLSHGLSALLWLAGIYLVILSRSSEDESVGAGHRDGLRPVLW